MNRRSTEIPTVYLRDFTCLITLSESTLDIQPQVRVIGYQQPTVNDDQSGQRRDFECEARIEKEQCVPPPPPPEPGAASEETRSPRTDRVG